MKEHVRAHAIISGRVQGVYYRMETLHAVEGIGGICGWVRNRRDGRVEAVFEGGVDSVDQILAWCRKGPSLASVRHVSVEWQPYTGEFDDFRIRY